jgi:tetratricopeptide (TPR) repeat protein
MGTLCHHTGNSTLAGQHYRRALAIHREVGNRRFEGIILGHLAAMAQDRSQINQASEYYEQALRTHREVGNRRFEAVVLGSMGTFYHVVGDLIRARETLQQALRIHREVENRASEGIVLGNLGDLELEMGELEAGEASLREAIAINDRARPAPAGAFRGSLALLCAQRKDFSQARELMQTARSQLKGADATEYAKLICRQARIEALAVDWRAADEALTQAIAMVAEQDSSPDSYLGMELQETRRVLEQERGASPKPRG